MLQCIASPSGCTATRISRGSATAATCARVRNIAEFRGIRTRASAGVAQPTEQDESLAAKLGGMPAVKQAVEVFYGKMLSDERVSFFFEGVDMKKQKGHQTAFLNFAMGGSKSYDGNANMTTAHARLVRDMGMTMQHFDITVEHLEEALQELEVPQDLIAQTAAKVESLRPAFQVAIDDYTPQPELTTV